MTAKPRVIWFDDELHGPDCANIANCLREAFDLVEVQVDSANDLELGLREVFESCPSLAIVDWQLGIESIDGVQLAQRILQNWYGPIVFLTRFPKRDQFRRHLDPRPPMLEVDKPDTRSMTGPEIADWCLHLMERIRSAIVETPSRLKIDFGEDQGRFLSLQVEDAEALSFSELIARKLRTTDFLDNELGSIFSASDDIPWVILTDWPPIVLRVGEPGSSPPESAAMNIYSAMSGTPVLLVLRPASVNSLEVESVGEVTTSGCVAEGTGARYPDGVDWFPTVNLEFKGFGLDLHFDTGAELTYWSYDELRALNLLRSLDDKDDWGTQKLRVGLAGRKAIAVHPLMMTLRLPSDPGHLTVRVQAYVALDFAAAGLALKCKEGECPLFVSGGTGYCSYRRGLLGRDLLIQSGLSALVSTSQRQVLFFEEMQRAGLLERFTQKLPGSGRKSRPR